MLYIKLQGHRSIGSGEEDFLRVLPYMDMAVMFGHVTQLIYINFHSHSPLSFHMRFGFKSLNFFCETSFNFEI